jgi:D-proline reductase (dithiol) PrdB
MAFIDEFPEAVQSRIVDQDLPEYGPTAAVGGPPLSERRIAIVTTAGLHRRSETPFGHGTPEYKVIPDDIDITEIVMSHASTNYDRTGYQQDINICFPVDRLHELAENGTIGSVAKYHYAFMGATPPHIMEAPARDVAKLLKEDGVDGVLLVPV